MSSSWIRILLLVVVGLLAIQAQGLERNARAPKPKFIRFGRAGGGGQKFIRFGRSGAAAHAAQLGPQDIYADDQIYDQPAFNEDLSDLDTAAPVEVDDWQQMKRGGPKFIRFG